MSTLRPMEIINCAERLGLKHEADVLRRSFQDQDIEGDYTDLLYGPPVVHTRSCPDMPGVQMQYIGNDMYMNPITGDVYDFHNGYRANGIDYPGGSVREQTMMDSTFINNIPHDVLLFRRSK